MFIDNHNNQIIIDVPRGQNIGATILQELNDNNIVTRTFKAITVARRPKERINTVTLKLKP